MTEAQISEAAQGFYELSLIKQVLLLVGISLSIAVGVYVVFWSQTPNFVPVYNQLDSLSAGEVMDALQKSAIPHKLDSQTGLVMVEASKIFEARIKLAQNGVTGNMGAGLEILDKDAGLGTSQFIETTRYIRGLQGELERTISSIQNIKSARVHLAIPKQSEFIRNKKNPSASVFVNLYGGYNLGSEQIAAITHLVASSIQGLSTKDVTVIDQNGNLLSTTGNDKIANASKNLDFAKKIEEMYSSRIEDLIEPMVGVGQIKAKVTAVVDFTSQEETSENFNPKTAVVRSERTLEISKEGGDFVGGVPGALSNEPPVTGSAPERADNENNPDENQANTKKENKNQKRQATKNYEIDRKITHRSSAPGRVERLSVAVVIGDKVSYDAKGKMVKTPLSEDEMKNVEKLVKDAIGFSEERKDTVTIIKSTFAENAPIEDLAPPTLFEKTWFMPMLKNIIGGIILLMLILVVLRPMFKNLTKVSAQKKEMLKRIASEQNFNEAAKGIQGASPSLIKVKDIVNEDPKRAAQVIKKWVEVGNG